MYYTQDSKHNLGGVTMAYIWFIAFLVFFIRYNKFKKQHEKVEALIKKEEMHKSNISNLEKGIEKKLSTIRNLDTEISKLEKSIEELETSEFVEEFEVYSSIYNLEKSGVYLDFLKECRFKQKQMMKDKEAAVCNISWTIDGSEKKGKAHANAYEKLILKAFNGECDSIISKVKYNNVYKIEERLEKLQGTLNKLAEKNHFEITDSYLDLKIKELKLVFEYQEKLQEEKEEQREIRELMREEEKVRREIAREEAKAQKEEKDALIALEKAREELKNAHGDELDKLSIKLAELEAKLEEAKLKMERTKSMAEQTRAGHVYIISNIGSFGENVYKIGMTRRLEPLDRVKELGDASVPFKFDVHAMIYSEDAPTLEKSLHNKFTNHRVNKVNLRKEFFNVSLNEIEQEARKNNSDFYLTKIAEAQEYRETQTMN